MSLLKIVKQYLVTFADEVCTKRVDVVLDPTDIGVKKVAYHPGGGFEAGVA